VRTARPPIGLRRRTAHGGAESYSPCHVPTLWCDNPKKLALSKLNDLWALNFGTSAWRELKPLSLAAPVARCGARTGSVQSVAKRPAPGRASGSAPCPSVGPVPSRRFRERPLSRSVVTNIAPAAVQLRPRRRRRRRRAVRPRAVPHLRWGLLGRCCFVRAFLALMQNARSSMGCGRAAFADGRRSCPVQPRVRWIHAVS
jgi:hypothetical protein